MEECLECGESFEKLHNDPRTPPLEDPAVAPCLCDGCLDYAHVEIRENAEQEANNANRKISDSCMDKKEQGESMTYEQWSDRVYDKGYHLQNTRIIYKMHGTPKNIWYACTSVVVLIVYVLMGMAMGIMLYETILLPKWYDYEIKPESKTEQPAIKKAGA